MLSRAIPFLLLPILTKYLSPSEYGIVSFVLVVQSFFVLIIDFGMSNHIGVNYYRKQTMPTALLSEAVAILFIAGMLLSPMVVAIDLARPGIFQLSRPWLAVLVFSSMFRVLFNMLMMFWQLEQKAIIYAILQNASTLLETSLTIYFVVMRNDGWMGRIGSNFVTGIFFGALSLMFFFLKFDLNLFTSGFRRLGAVAFSGAPLILHGAGAWFINSADRFLIVKLDSANAAGVYVAAAQISSIVSFVTMAFNQAWSPYLWRTLSEGEESEKYRLVKISYLYLVCLFVLCISCYAVFSLSISFVFNIRYVGAIRYLPLMLGQMFFWGMYYMATNYIFYAKQTMKLALVTFANGILSLVLNILLIPRFGAFGSAVSGLIVSFTYMVSVWCLAWRVYPMPWMSVISQWKSEVASQIANR